MHLVANCIGMYIGRDVHTYVLDSRMCVCHEDDPDEPPSRVSYQRLAYEHWPHIGMAIGGFKAVYKSRIWISYAQPYIYLAIVYMLNVSAHY